MKFLTVFVALIAVAVGHQATWTLPQLSEAIQNPNTDAALLPYLELALNEIMEALISGQQVEAVSVSVPAVDLSSWTLHQLSEAIQSPSTDPALLPYLEHALNQMMDAIVSGQPQEVIAVAVPAMDVSSWSLSELSDALGNPSTNPALVPYLENALNELMATLASGQQQESIAIAIPAGLIPVESPIVPTPVITAPTPVITAPTPVVTAPVESPIVPAPVDVPSSPLTPASPLVQIIVNVKQQSVAAAVPVAPVAAPEVALEAAEPVIVAEQAAEPVQVVDQVVQAPAPVIVAPIILPEPVIVAPINPIDLHPIGIQFPGAAVVGPMI